MLKKKESENANLKKQLEDMLDAVKKREKQLESQS